MAEYIDREAFTGLFWGEQNLYSWEEIEEFMDAIPAADVQPVVHGKWEEVDNVIFLCSECKHASGRTPFCAWCGAKMDGGT